MIRLLTVILITGLSLSFLYAQEGNKLHKTFPVKKEVELKITSGDCIVKTGSTDEIIVDMVSDVRPEGSFEPEIRETGNTLKIRERWHGSSSGHVTWTITVPPETDFEFSAASGDLSISGLKSKLETSTASGEITIENCTGEFNCSAASGDISLSASQGEFDISTASGDVNVENSSGEFDISTASGEIKVNDVTGLFELSCASGEIDAKKIIIEEEGSFSTASGDIKVILARSPEVDVTLSAASGDVELDYNGNEITGYFEFSANKRRGRIVSPFDFDKEEEIDRHDEIYLLKSFTKGSSKPFITLETSSGKAVLKK
jgi:DUF4097 and DUF4098 domain-containing protein YvlB